MLERVANVQDLMGVELEMSLAMSENFLVGLFVANFAGDEKVVEAFAESCFGDDAAYALVPVGEKGCPVAAFAQFRKGFCRGWLGAPAMPVREFVPQVLEELFEIRGLRG